MLTRVLCSSVVLCSLTVGCATPAPHADTEAAAVTDPAPSPASAPEPPPAIRAWMDRLTVRHDYDPATGFIVARETIALPDIIAAAPPLDEAIGVAGASGRVVIAFATADRCAPCQQYKKDALNDPRVIARLGDPRLLATHVEVDRRPDLAREHLGSLAIPMTYALRDGRRISELRGQRSADDLLAWIDALPVE